MAAQKFFELGQGVKLPMVLLLISDVLSDVIERRLADREPTVPLLPGEAACSGERRVYPL